MSKIYTAYTGTFTTQNGKSRTMTFIKNEDIPSSIIGEGSRQQTNGNEVVYDIDRGGFRTLNWDTVQGYVTHRKINFSFESTHSQR